MTPAKQSVAAPAGLTWWDAAVATVIGLLALPSGMGTVDWQQVGWHNDFSAPITILAATASLYVTLGRSAIRRGSKSKPLKRRDYLFVALQAPLLGFGCMVSPGFATLQVIAYPMIWSVLPRYRYSVIASAAIALMVGVGSALGYYPETALGLETAILTAALSFLLAVGMGSWISHIFYRGEEQRLLAERLRSAQAEVASLSTAAGAAAERERLSRELHDTLTQTLTGLVMLSEQAQRALADGQFTQAENRLARVSSAAREATQEARALVATTQPLGDGGLEQALRRVAHRLSQDCNLQVELDFEPQPIDREAEVVLLRAAQEALANVRKHAHAKTARVRLYSSEGSVILQVSDDGIGLSNELSLPPDPTNQAQPELSSTGFGLVGLQQRVRLAGGELTLTSGVTHGGTVLTVRLPEKIEVGP